MLVTNNGTIEAVPHTSMVKENGVWRYLLVCRVSPEITNEELTALFSTDTVEDDAIGVKWEYTSFVKITADDSFKYVWLYYTERTIASAQYAEALNVLGVETEVVENEAV